MEGVKILSEEIIVLQTNNVEMFLLLVFCFIVGLLSYLSFGVKDYIRGFVALIVAVCTLIGSFLWWRSKEVEIKEYKITPIEDKYFINAMDYKVVEVEQNIITIREKVE